MKLVASGDDSNYHGELNNSSHLSYRKPVSERSLCVYISTATVPVPVPLPLG